MNNLKKQMIIGFNALLSEVDESIVDDLRKRFDNYSTDIEKRLLECCRNLGHPAYEHSYSTHEAIDNLRAETFDFLEIPES